MNGGLAGLADCQAYDERAQEALESVYKEYPGAILPSRAVRAWHNSLLGSGLVPLPGNLSRAHHGVFLLDDLPECRRHVLEVLRQPIEKRGTLRPSYVWHRALGAGCAGAAPMTAPHARRWRLTGSGTVRVLAAWATRGVSLAHRSTAYPSAVGHEQGALQPLEPSALARQLATRRRHCFHQTAVDVTSACAAIYRFSSMGIHIDTGVFSH
jgi:Magnesium chelatase, subunit ChlI